MAQHQLIAVAAGAALVAALGASVWLYGKAQYRDGRHALAAEYQAADLAEWRRQSERLAGLSIMLEESLTILRDAEPKIIERYTHEVVRNPLPDGCRLDDGRLQHINAAIGAANAARQSGRTVPADPAR